MFLEVCVRWCEGHVGSPSAVIIELDSKETTRPSAFAMSLAVSFSYTLLPMPLSFNFRLFQRI
jgi:hypothetical protein